MNQTKHLEREQLAPLLHSGVDLAPELREHLVSCTLCRQRLLWWGVGIEAIMNTELNTLKMSLPQAEELMAQWLALSDAPAPHSEQLEALLATSIAPLLALQVGREFLELGVDIDARQLSRLGLSLKDLRQKVPSTAELGDALEDEALGTEEVSPPGPHFHEGTIPPMPDVPQPHPAEHLEGPRIAPTAQVVPRESHGWLHHWLSRLLKPGGLGMLGGATVMATLTLVLLRQPMDVNDHLISGNSSDFGVKGGQGSLQVAFNADVRVKVGEEFKRIARPTSREQSIVDCPVGAELQFRALLLGSGNLALWEITEFSSSSTLTNVTPTGNQAADDGGGPPLAGTPETIEAEPGRSPEASRTRVRLLQAWPPRRYSPVPPLKLSSVDGSRLKPIVPNSAETVQYVLTLSGEPLNTDITAQQLEALSSDPKVGLAQITCRVVPSEAPNQR